MSQHNRKLLVIIAESALERRLAEDAMRLGAHGYTVMDVRGAGSRGQRSGAWEAESTIRMEIVCDDGVARAVSEHVKQTYFDHYAVTLFISDVEVLRPDKF